MPPERSTAAQAALARLLRPLDGERIPGGCACCEAYQEVEPLVAGVWSITVRHDDDCPFLAKIEARGG